MTPSSQALEMARDVISDARDFTDCFSCGEDNAVTVLIGLEEKIAIALDSHAEKVREDTLEEVITYIENGCLHEANCSYKEIAQAIRSLKKP